MSSHSDWKHFSLTHITYPTNDPVAPLLALLSLTPPFAICALTSSVLVHKDVTAAYLLMGCLLIAAGCSVLKIVWKEKRPVRFHHDEPVEYGMPSNHSAFAWFGATFVVLYLLRGGNVWCALHLTNSNGNVVELSSSPGDSNNYTGSHKARETRWRTFVKFWHFLHTQVTILASTLLASGCSYSRVHLGYHTTRQVVVGSVLGIAFGYVWYRMFEMGFVKRGLISVKRLLNELEISRRRLYWNDETRAEKKSE
jgi:dolichyldiphosphatase